ncbi:putative lipoprotein [Myxococcus stipitatus DSM 14675]|uniref:Putative lipoprotein n=1 Tax=Myxococcus stipitatus (strain DSM 14675 / JCM 12634 / Mx s8) TaxID=1278073 RepID=L7U9P4_MYXSD|nr:putative lipoprotein [Myxococcus stipitatus DSM 14675]
MWTGCDEAPSRARASWPDEECAAVPNALRVVVLSAEGVRVRGATVTATNLTSNASISGVTDSDGVTTAINETLAPSPVRVVAVAGARVSPASRVDWVCDTCNCVPEPADLTLELDP